MHFHRHGWGPEGYGFAGRGGGRRGFGGGGRGFMGGPMGGAMRFGRMLADGDLRLIVLTLLEEAPRHGYDIIKALEERSHGAYSPSPGVVYPTLTYLDEAGYAAASAEGNKKVYAITDAGRGHLADNRDAADMILSSMERYGAKMAKARAWFYRHEEGGTWDIPGVLPEVNEARWALKGAIAEKLDAPESDQRETARILRDAANAIRAVGRNDEAT